MHHCCYGANGPRTWQFGWNGIHRRDQEEASCAEDIGGNQPLLTIRSGL